MEDKKDNYLHNLRHSCAHLMACAVGELFPNIKITLGPPIENGFYYDLECGNQISEDDLIKIENKMREIVADWSCFEKQEVAPDEAKNIFKDNPYKLELIGEIVEKKEPITIYKSGNFVDLCKGGHVKNPKEELKHFKLLSIAGAYWRGDEKNKMLTRIYGTVFPTKKELDDYLLMLEEAKKRDHKKLGIELDLFYFSDLVGPGLPLWTPKGTIMRILLDDFVWKLRQERGYQKVEIPHITKKDLYEMSGHWDKFKNELFKIKTREGHDFVMKPMNCPHHVQIYNHLQRSYKELPQRYATTTICYRDEQTGELAGLSRTRAFTQDDAHAFCRKNQIEDEFLKIWDIVDGFYGAFGFQLKVRLSYHDPENMDAYLGDEETWISAEKIITKLAKERKADYYEAVGEAAFYGPKIDFMAHDSLGREWQVATIQLDMNMPERFNLFCINEKGEEERIFMLHAAIMGSIERFLAILIEHYSGAFPLWLSPIQVVILPVSEKNLETSQKIYKILNENGIRVELDAENKTLPSKIRYWTLQKAPYMCIIGEREEEKSKDEDIFLSLRSRKGDEGMVLVREFLRNLRRDIENKI